MAPPQTTGLVWFRGGLRLRDNTALTQALIENEQVFCLYVLDDAYLRAPDIGTARLSFLFDSLRDLSEDLARAGGQLLLRQSPEVPEEVLRVAQELGAGRIYFNEDYLPYPRQRDANLRSQALSIGIEVCSYPDLLLVPPTEVFTEKGTPYTVFTPFKRRWLTTLKILPQQSLDPLLPKLKSAPNSYTRPIPTLKDYGLHRTQNLPLVGEKVAQQRLAQFLRDDLPTYHESRNVVANPNGTSRLSVYLKWGTLSIRDCYREALRVGGAGAEKWIDELAWREFFYSVAYHFPKSLEEGMIPLYREFEWSGNREHLEAWKAGQTGYPFVDAGMRQLNATGWMHNRLRQVTASYLCKDLCIHWQEGERYFMQNLVDGDWANNSGGWQWVAGAGTDPRRATRIFNPTLQQEKYDPEAQFVREWVPEYGTSRYPTPIVSHEEGRAEYLRRYAKLRGREAHSQANNLES